MSWSGRNWSLSREWWAGSVEWSLSTFDMWHHTLGTLRDAHTLCVNSWRLSCLGTSLGSHHQAVMSSCCVHNFIHSIFSLGEGSGIKVVGGHHLLLCWLEASLLPSGTPGCEALEEADTQGQLLQSWTNWIGQLAPFCSPRLAGGALWHWYPSCGWRLPTILIRKGWVMGLAF